ncbi:hypothetical protein L596_014373 [Steinernema carpocapsae]|uniref:Uncharacterized protein n=1 Tax=Steinernema carpocapsae TaxID=34508 RepID=A0A4V6A2T1_STECR|nr:hypothetical protein L596_014373 [Steinernema carpocapsae]
MKKEKKKKEAREGHRVGTTGNRGTVARWASEDVVVDGGKLSRRAKKRWKEGSECRTDLTVSASNEIWELLRDYGDLDQAVFEALRSLSLCQSKVTRFQVVFQ